MATEPIRNATRGAHRPRSDVPRTETRPGTRGQLGSGGTERLAGIGQRGSD